MNPFERTVWLLIALSLILTAALLYLDRSSLTPEQRGDVQLGKNIYDGLCAPCHNAKTDLHLLKKPPNIDRLFAKERFPSGVPATDEEFRKVVLHGRGIMPSFELNGEDLRVLLAYMHRQKPEQ